jgi:hypothetical protein
VAATALPPYVASEFAMSTTSYQFIAHLGRDVQCGVVVICVVKGVPKETKEASQPAQRVALERLG